MSRFFNKIAFEYRITLAYLIVGGLWILFSDRFVYIFASSEEAGREFQTLKGWFYVAITGVLFFFFLRKHLKHMRSTEAELLVHKNNLQHLVQEKTRVLHRLNNELVAANEELQSKHEFINKQNSELKETLKNLKETQSQLFETEKLASLGTLTAGVAHEINNPLNYLMGSYMGFSSYFKEHGSMDDEKTRLLLQGMKEGIDRASKIVSGLNEFSRDNSNYDEVCDIHAILDNCLVILQNKTKHRIEILKKYKGDGIRVTGNSGKLHQVFLNILNNAIEAISGPGEINILSENLNGSVKIEIVDNGEGIPKEHLSQVTTPFFTTKPPGKGTGLGLSISYSIIKEHKGTLDLESEVSKGTKVRILLPVRNHE